MNYKRLIVGELLLLTALVSFNLGDKPQENRRLKEELYRIKKGYIPRELIDHGVYYEFQDKDTSKSSSLEKKIIQL